MAGEKDTQGTKDVQNVQDVNLLDACCEGSRQNVQGSEAPNVREEGNIQNVQCGAVLQNTNDSSELTPLRKYQLYVLDITKYFIQFCKEHNLKYFAAYGTLIGAARHNGFIPWDDDIDIWMPVEDYTRFRELARTELDSKYYFQSHLDNVHEFICWQRIGVKNSTSMPYAYKHVPASWGVCIDIFPLVVAPSAEDKTQYKVFHKRCVKAIQAAARHEYKADIKTSKGIQKLLYMIRSAGSDEQNLQRFAELEKEIFEASGYEDSGYVSTITRGSYFMRAKCFEETIQLPFEDILIDAPAGYDEVLSVIYGEDWMELPPEEERVYHGGGGSDEVCVSLERSWIEFQNELN